MGQKAMITQGYAKSMVQIKNYEPRDKRKARPQSRLTKDSQNSHPPHWCSCRLVRATYRVTFIARTISMTARTTYKQSIQHSLRYQQPHTYS